MSKLTEHEKLNQRLEVTTKKDFSGTHNLGQPFDLPILNALETKNVSSSSIIEMMAEINRMNGASGIIGMRQYTHSVYGDPGERVWDVNIGGVSMHNHPNYRSMPGSAEFTAMLNGYYIRSRHNDYRAFSPVTNPTNYLARKEILPCEVPAAVSALPMGSGLGSATPFAPGTQYEYMKNVLTNNPQDCTYLMSYIECWWEVFDNNDVGDHTDSFRHAIDAANMRQALDKALFFNQGGHKNRKENIPYEPIMIRKVNDDGSNTIAVFRYRINVYPVATPATTPVTKTLKYKDGTSITLTLQPLPYDKTKAVNGVIDATNAFKLRKELRQRWRQRRKETNVRSWAQIIDTRYASFDLDPNTMIALCESIPGIDGPNHNLLEKYTDYGITDTITDFGTTNPRNSVFYNRNFSFLNDDAAGRSNAHRGFNDPNMFVAMTDSPKVVGGFTYMIPYELVLYTPRDFWNPDNLPDLGSRAAVNGGGTITGTQTDPYPGIHYDEYYYMMPSDMYDINNLPGIDPADTRNQAWVINPATGTAKHYLASGVNIFDYDMSRRRFAINPVYGNFSKAACDLHLLKKELKLLLKNILAGTATAADIDNAF